MQNKNRPNRFKAPAPCVHKQSYNFALPWPVFRRETNSRYQCQRRLIIHYRFDEVGMCDQSRHSSDYLMAGDQPFPRPSSSLPARVAVVTSMHFRSLSTRQPLIKMMNTATIIRVLTDTSSHHRFQWLRFLHPSIVSA